MGILIRHENQDINVAALTFLENLSFHFEFGREYVLHDTYTLDIILESDLKALSSNLPMMAQTSMLLKNFSSVKKFPPSKIEPTLRACIALLDVQEPSVVKNAIAALAGYVERGELSPHLTNRLGVVKKYCYIIHANRDGTGEVALDALLSLLFKTNMEFDMEPIVMKSLARGLQFC